MSPTRLAPLLLLLVTACSPIAVSPALRTVPLETAATTRPGHVGMRLGGGIHSDGWGQEVGVAQGGVGIGLVDDVELQLDGTFADSDGLSQRTVSPFFGAGHLGLKHRVLPWLAFTGGTGAGSGPWGAFAGGDLGVILAYENPYVVPFFAARVQLSMPIDAQTERFVDSNHMTTLLTPGATFWFQPSTGVRIPLCSDTSCDGTRVSLTVAIAWTQITQIDAPHDGGAIGIEGGLTIEP